MKGKLSVMSGPRYGASCLFSLLSLYASGGATARCGAAFSRRTIKYRLLEGGHHDLLLRRSLIKPPRFSCTYSKPNEAPEQHEALHASSFKHLCKISEKPSESLICAHTHTNKRPELRLLLMMCASQSISYPSPTICITVLSKLQKPLYLFILYFFRSCNKTHS